MARFQDHFGGAERDDDDLGGAQNDLFIDPRSREQDNDTLDLFNDGGVNSQRDAVLFLVDCNSSMFKQHWIPVPTSRSVAALQHDEDGEDDDGDAAAARDGNDDDDDDETKKSNKNKMNEKAKQSNDEGALLGAMLHETHPELESQQQQQQDGRSRGAAQYSSMNNNNEESDTTTRYKYISGVKCVKGRSAFNAAILAIRDCYQQKAIQSDRDICGLVLYNTAYAVNTLNFDHIFMFHDLKVPDVARMKELEILARAGVEGDTTAREFHAVIGNGDVAVAKKMRARAEQLKNSRNNTAMMMTMKNKIQSDRLSFAETLWAASHFLNSIVSKKITTRRIMIFTDDDNPTQGNIMEEHKCIARMADFNSAGISVEVYGRGIDVNSFAGDEAMLLGAINASESRTSASSAVGQQQMHQGELSQDHQQQQQLDEHQQQQNYFETQQQQQQQQHLDGGETMMTMRMFTAGATMASTSTTTTTGTSSATFNSTGRTATTVGPKNAFASSDAAAAAASRAAAAAITSAAAARSEVLHTFDPTLFWDKLLSLSNDRVGAQHGTADGLLARVRSMRNDTNIDADLVLGLGGGDDPRSHLHISEWSNGVDLDDLREGVRRKVYPQRAITALPLRVGRQDGCSPHCVVGVFSPVQKCSKPRTTQLETNTNAIVSTERKKVSSITGLPISDGYTGPGLMAGGGFSVSNPMSTAGLSMMMPPSSGAMMMNNNNNNNINNNNIDDFNNMMAAAMSNVPRSAAAEFQERQEQREQRNRQAVQERFESTGVYNVAVYDGAGAGGASVIHTTTATTTTRSVPPQQPRNKFATDMDGFVLPAAPTAASNNNNYFGATSAAPAFPPVSTGGGFGFLLSGGNGSTVSRPAPSSSSGPCGMLHTLDVNGSRVVFSPQELKYTNQAVNHGESGINIMCFLPRSWMDQHSIDWHCGRTNFIAPHKKFNDHEGSKFFLTLWKVMTDKKVVGVAELVRGKLQAPKMCIVYPADERPSPHDAYASVAGSGFFIKAFPYAEDYRDLRLPAIPEEERLPASGRQHKKDKKKQQQQQRNDDADDPFNNNFQQQNHRDDGDGGGEDENNFANALNRDLQQALFQNLSDADKIRLTDWEDDVERARKIIAKSTVKNENVVAVGNPTLQRIYYQLERLALTDAADGGGDAEDLLLDSNSNVKKKEPVDHTLPHRDAMERGSGKYVKKLKQYMIKDDYNPNQFLPKPVAAAAAGAGAGTGSSSAGGAAATAARAVAAGGTKVPSEAVMKTIDFDEMSQAGTLNKLTVPYLHWFLKKEGLSTSGKKEDQVKRVSEFLARQRESGQRRGRDGSV